MPRAEHVSGSLGTRTGERTLSSSISGDAAITALVVALGLLLSWGTTYLAGGSKTSVPHAFYIPVIVAAVRFGPVGALLVSAAAAIAAGPLMPLDVEDATAQATANWLTRGAIFVIVGQLTAYLVRHSVSSITAEVSARLLRRDLSVAVASNQLRLAYQPIVDIRAGGIAGAEALIRWEHPERGLVSPADFIPQAERTDCIAPITRWVVGEALRQTARWRTGVLSGATHFTISVNISAKDLADPDLIAHVRCGLEETGVPPSWLHLEITETALMEDVDAAAEGLVALRSLGVQIAMDDFGAGESSLGQLGRLTVEVIKIDRIFLRQIEHQEFGGTLIAGIASLAKSMGVITVVEGIETSTDASIARDSGCDLAQGYLFSPPVTSDDLAALLRDPGAFDRRHLDRLGVPV